MSIAQNEYKSDNIYKYSISLTYVLDDTTINISTEQIKSVAIDSNYKKMNMPMIFITASIHSQHISLMEENQDTGIFILKIKKAIANSNMTDLYIDHINDKFIYFITQDLKEIVNKEDQNQDVDNKDANEREDLYKTVSFGLLSFDCVNKNKKVVNGVVNGNLVSLMYYITGHLPIVIENPTNNVEFSNRYIPPMNSVSKSLEYLNAISVFYNTPYRFFIDFDCAYLLSSSGLSIAKKGDEITTVLIDVKDTEKDSSLFEGNNISGDKSIYKLLVDTSDCFISDMHISGKSYSNIAATGTSGKLLKEQVIDTSTLNVNSKTRTIRISNDNYGILDNILSSLNRSSIQLLIQKDDIDSSIITMNKEYIIKADEAYGDNKYNGRYLLTRKRELYIKTDNNFVMDTMLLFEKIPEK